MGLGSGFAPKSCLTRSGLWRRRPQPLPRRRGRAAPPTRMRACNAYIYACMHTCALMQMGMHMHLHMWHVHVMCMACAYHVHGHGHARAQTQVTGACYVSKRWGGATNPHVHMRTQHKSKTMGGAACTCTCTHACACACKRTHPQMHTCMRMCTHMHMHAAMQTHTRASLRIGD